MARNEARAAAMQMIYEAMLGGEGGEQTLTGLLAMTPSDEDAAYIREAVAGVCERAEELDSRIARHLVNWTLERLSRVDLAILRLAVYEMAFRDDIPSAVAINEALELSHRFSTDEAAGFINGVLGSLLRAGDARP
jgi:N utilization substance protein B